MPANLINHLFVKDIVTLKEAFLALSDLPWYKRFLPSQLGIALQAFNSDNYASLLAVNDAFNQTSRFQRWLYPCLDIRNINRTPTEWLSKKLADFAVLPEQVTSISLRHLYCHDVTIPELITAIAAIPTHVSSIDLTLSFKKISGAELAHLFSVLPANLAAINLSYNELSMKELAQAFAQLPATLTSIDLSGNSLGSKSSANLARIFEKLPASLRIINLGNNGFSAMNSGTELAHAFAKLPANLRSIDFSSNRLGTIACDDLIEIMQSLPTSLNTIILDSNQFNFKTGAELARIFAKIPAMVTSISLRNSHLWINSAHNLRTPNELVPAFSSIPDHVTWMDLADNGLSYEEISSIPPHITSINLSGNSLFTNFESKPTLPNIKNMTLSSSSVVNFCKNPENVEDFKRAFPGITELEDGVSFENDIGRIEDSFDVLKRMGVIPSLKLTCAHFIRNNIPSEECQSLSEQLQSYLNQGRPNPK